MNLIIVESPTKARTITKFVGKNYIVKSSFGHVRDLPKSTLGIDTQNDFTPEYITPPKAEKVVKELQSLSKKADEIILATDEDREGEAISWHLLTALKIKKNTPIKRIVFHEITKKAILHALDNPRTLDVALVDAQQARRVLDRLVGYELSPFLWSKIRRGLSAGRVQSVALRFIVEREKERKAFAQKKYYKISVTLSPQSDIKTVFTADLTHIETKKISITEKMPLYASDYKISSTIITDLKNATEIKDDLKNATYSVSAIEEKETRRYPTPPFTTSTLQQSAISRLGYSSKQTMMLAQKLYEVGLITYMRTDSVFLSEDSIKTARAKIIDLYGKKYIPDTPNHYKSKSKGAQEAHEAIRPTDPTKIPDMLSEKLDNRQFKLYRLIWQRMIASQMTPALFNSMKLIITAKKDEKTYTLSAQGSRILFEGYMIAYGKGSSTDDIILPPLTKDDILSVSDVSAEEKSTTEPPRYSEATLVKVLEERGIGRPSTYAPTISTLFDRSYIERDEQKKLYPEEIGILVTELLIKHFSTIVDREFTAHLEEKLDDIADGKIAWVPVVREFYNPFHTNLTMKQKEVKKEDLQEKIGRACPECSSDLIIKFGRFGKFIACSKYPECKYTEKTDDEKKQDEEFKGEKCENCGKSMVVKRGRFGAFLGCSGYPDCKTIKKIEKVTGVSCPKCKNGLIVERNSRKGRTFYGCNTYPKCDFALWSKPTGKKCPDCSELLVFGAKDTDRCSNKECSFTVSRS